jgi:hypothetical protein
MFTLKQINEKFLEESERDQDDFIDLLLESVLPEFMLFTMMKTFSLERNEALIEIKELGNTYRESDMHEILNDFKILKKY